MLIEEIIFERSRASLYHTTSLKSAYSILTSNMLKFGNTKDMNVPDSISFTRNPRFFRYYSEITVRFEFDQDKLKTRHKIIPYRWKHIAGNRNAWDEAEERITGNIDNIDDYIIEIIFSNPPVVKSNVQILFRNFVNFFIESGFDGNIYDFVNQKRIKRNFSSYFYPKRNKEFSEQLKDIKMLYYLVNHPKFDKKTEIKDMLDDFLKKDKNDVA